MKAYLEKNVYCGEGLVKAVLWKYLLLIVKPLEANILTRKDRFIRFLRVG